MIGSPATTGVRHIAILLVMVTLAAAGCDSDRRRANARLRTQVHDLQEELDAAKLQVAELEAQLKSHAEDRGLDAQLLVNTPHVSEIALSPFSGMRRDDGTTSTLELYVSAVDGRGRPLQMVGSLEGKVMYGPMHGAPIELGHLTMEPSEVRDAWRRGLDGTSYLMKIPLTQPIPAEAVILHAQVLHTDARTDQQHEASLDVRPTSPDQE